MKPVKLKIIIILSLSAGAIFNTKSLFSADISKARASRTIGGGSGSASSNYGPRPGTRAYYREMGRNDSGTPSRANLIEQTAELHTFLAATVTGALFVTPKRAEKKFVPYDWLLTVVTDPRCSPAGGTPTKHLEIPADFFSNYCAIASDKRSGERDFVPEDADASINPFSDKYRFLTTGRHYDTYAPIINTVDPALADTLAAPFKATSVTTAPPFSVAWLKALRTKASASTKASPIHCPRPAPSSPTPATATPITNPLPLLVLAADERPRRHELATAANAMARLAEFRQLTPLRKRRALRS